MSELKRTVFFESHVSLDAKMADFGGWEMPISYPMGSVDEHLATRRGAGLFDVSHMGRFRVTGEGAAAFLGKVLTSNVEALDHEGIGAQYTLIPTEDGSCIDDAYVYCFGTGEYLLVVNAGNARKDWEHITSLQRDFARNRSDGEGGPVDEEQGEAAQATVAPPDRKHDVKLQDVTADLAMLALQGPRSRSILEDLLEGGALPEPTRNSVSEATIAGAAVRIARTGYTGEPLGFELFVEREAALLLWGTLLERGATPVGLGARDTLRLEAGLPLYGHELGPDPDGVEMPLLSMSIAKVGLSFANAKGRFVGREALAKQFEAFGRIMRRDYSMISVLPRLVRPIALTGRGVARPGSTVLLDGSEVGRVTSGTMVPYCETEGADLASSPTGKKLLRSICLAIIDSRITEGTKVSVDVRGKLIPGMVVTRHLGSEAPPFARPMVVDHKSPERFLPEGDRPSKAKALLSRSLENHLWRQRDCVNLIPSEMTTSRMVRLLSMSDPAFRYAEHRKSKAFYDEEIFYYQGTEFIDEAERMLHQELRRFLGCAMIESRVISGQMANMAVFSAMVEYINRVDRKSEPRRIGRVMNHQLAKGGHLSAQPMGALRDFVARDPRTERPAVVNLPVLPDNPFKTDVPRALELIDKHRPELLILGKSMVLHTEPVAEMRRFIDDHKLDTVIMYDMAHVMGLVGPHFQEPFQEGADLVTGSTHKTFFGTQRGIVAGNIAEADERYHLWEAIERRAFPGSTSNHHLGTLLGLLMASLEMNHFKDEYQRTVIANAKSFALALRERGLDVAGDPDEQFTQTHQVIVRVGYGRGPEMATRLEENNIICNYQAMPDEEGFTVAGGLRFGVSEMSRFGMQPEDFHELADLIRDVVVENRRSLEAVKAFRARFLDLRFCFDESDLDDLLHEFLGARAPAPIKADCQDGS